MSVSVTGVIFTLNSPGLEEIEIVVVNVKNVQN